MTSTSRKARSSSGAEATAAQADAEQTDQQGHADEPIKAGPAADPAQAAPLTPPAKPAPPAPDPGPAPQIRMLATPGAEFVDLLWGDNAPGTPMEKAQPGALFIDQGPQFSTVIVARPLIRLFHMPGGDGTVLGEQLFKGAGVAVDRGHAMKIEADLAAIRAAE
ncbi:hypothetical protein [Nonomuraea candida]|uniref:hypothetical protein n=1 Tax=Nonomuraea candida TaxID=359159 RepID=UPI0005BCBA0D|nr:hypothetical protein [Nonomuraea candida]